MWAALNEHCVQLPLTVASKTLMPFFIWWQLNYLSNTTILALLESPLSDSVEKQGTHVSSICFFHKTICAVYYHSVSDPSIADICTFWLWDPRQIARWTTLKCGVKNAIWLQKKLFEVKFVIKCPGCIFTCKILYLK